MFMEAALLESRTLRSGLCERTEVLDEVKALVLLPDGLYVTTRMVADYFEVSEPAVYSLLRRHRAELESNGFTVLRPVDNPSDQTFKTNGWQVSGLRAGYERSEAAELSGAPVDNFADQTPYRPQGGGNGVALYSKRAVLNVAMLLRDSEVARQVRGRLLDLVEMAARPVVEPPVVHTFRARPWKRWSELRWDEYEAGRRDPGVEAWRRRIDGLEPFESHLPAGEPELPEGEPEFGFTTVDLPEVVSGLAVSVAGIERRLDAQGVLITAIAERVSGLGEDVRAIRRDVAHLRGRRQRRRRS